jgi:hypothetical protein
MNNNFFFYFFPLLFFFSLFFLSSSFFSHVPLVTISLLLLSILSLSQTLLFLPSQSQHGEVEGGVAQGTGQRQLAGGGSDSTAVGHRLLACRAALRCGSSSSPREENDRGIIPYAFHPLAVHGCSNRDIPYAFSICRCSDFFSFTYAKCGVLDAMA